MRRRLVAVAALAVLAAGCGTPASVAKQAEEVHSVAAESSLLAHAAARGESLPPFTAAQARALRDRLDALVPAVRDARLARVAASVVRSLEALAEAPSDKAVAARVARSLDRAAVAADRVAR